MRSEISHWFPIVTRCPVGTIDLLYFTVEVDRFVDLYAVRKLFRTYWWKNMFMEDIAEGLQQLFWKEFRFYPKTVTVRLMGGTFNTSI